MAWENTAKYGDEIGQIIPILMSTSASYWPERLVRALKEELNTTPEECLRLPEEGKARDEFDSLVRRWRSFADPESVRGLIRNSGFVEAMPGGKAFLNGG